MATQSTAASSSTIQRSAPPISLDQLGGVVRDLPRHLTGLGQKGSQLGTQVLDLVEAQDLVRLEEKLGELTKAIEPLRAEIQLTPEQLAVVLLARARKTPATNISARDPELGTKRAEAARRIKNLEGPLNSAQALIERVQRNLPGLKTQKVAADARAEEQRLLDEQQQAARRRAKAAEDQAAEDTKNDLGALTATTRRKDLMSEPVSADHPKLAMVVQGLAAIQNGDLTAAQVDEAVTELRSAFEFVELKEADQLQPGAVVVTHRETSILILQVLVANEERGAVYVWNLVKEPPPRPAGKDPTSQGLGLPALVERGRSGTAFVLAPPAAAEVSDDSAVQGLASYVTVPIDINISHFSTAGGNYASYGHELFDGARGQIVTLQRYVEVSKKVDIQARVDLPEIDREIKRIEAALSALDDSLSLNEIVRSEYKQQTDALKLKLTPLKRSENRISALNQSLQDFLNTAYKEARPET